MRLSLERLRDFLRDGKDTDFKSADEFADKITAAIQKSFASGWESTRAVQAINRTTKQIYEFYRVKDTTVFADSSPIKLKLGGADTKSIKFIGDLDHFYFSKFANNTSEPMRNFFKENYFQNGAALFGRESSDELAEFRASAGEKLKNLTDRQLKTIVQTSVQRVRNWAHIGSLQQAEIDLARIVATLDARTTEVCRELDGKIIRVGAAHKGIQRLNQLEPGEFAVEVYENEIAKAISKEPVKTIQSYIEDDGVTISDKLAEIGRSIPPYHPNCRTRMEGIIDGLD